MSGDPTQKIGVRNKSGLHINPATEEKQDAIISAIGGITIDTGDIDLNTDGIEGLLTDIEANQLPDNHQVTVSNQPTDFPLPSAQVVTLTPPAAITGFSTSAKQDSQITLETTLNALVTIIKNTVTTNDKTHLLLQQIRDSISMRPDYVDATNSQNVSGSVSAAVSGSLTTVATLTNQTNIGGYTADMITENNSYQDWGLSIRSLII